MAITNVAKNLIASLTTTNAVQHNRQQSEGLNAAMQLIEIPTVLPIVRSLFTQSNSGISVFTKLPVTEILDIDKVAVVIRAQIDLRHNTIIKECMQHRVPSHEEM